MSLTAVPSLPSYRLAGFASQYEFGPVLVHAEVPHVGLVDLLHQHLVVGGREGLLLLAPPPHPTLHLQPLFFRLGNAPEADRWGRRVGWI